MHRQVALLQIDKICHTSATHGIAHERGSAALIHKIGSIEIARGDSKQQHRVSSILLALAPA